MISISYFKQLPTKRCLWLGLLILLWVSSLAAQVSDRLSFGHLTIEDGLSQNSINDIVQDKQGFLWLGTQDGLNRYDGYRFKAYKHQTGDSTSIPNSNWVEELAVDKNGGLWVGARDGLCLFNRALDQFQRIDFSKEAVPHVRISCLLTDAEGNVWVGSRQGLSKIHISENKYEFIHHSHTNKIPPLMGASINAVYEAPNKDLWVGTDDNGLILIKKGNFELADYVHYTAFAKQGAPVISHNQVHAIWTSEGGTVWVGTENGLNRIEPSKNIIDQYYFSPSTPNSLSDNRIAGGFQDSRGNIWVGTYSKGICLYNEDTDDFTIYQQDPSDARSLNDNNIIKSFFEDRTGIVWIGTQLGGLNKHDPNQVKFQHYKPVVGKNSLNDPIIRGFYKDAEGILWVCTQNGGLNGLDTSTGEWMQLMHDPNRPHQSIPSDFVKSVTRDRTGALWLGTRKDGVAKVVLQKNGNHIVTQYKADDIGFHSNEISNTFTVNDSIWVLDYNGGLSIYDSQINRFVRKTPKILEVNRRGLSVFNDKWGRIWVGGYYQLFCYDISTGKISSYEHDSANPDKFPKANIKSIYLLEKDWLWLGTSVGLIKWSPKEGILQQYGVQDGMANEMVYAALPDNYGNVWMSTNKGVSMLSVLTGQFKNYDVSDGLQSSEFNTGAYHRASDGQLFLGGINGFNSFYPSDISENPHAPQIAFTDFRLFSKKVPIKSEKHPDSPLTKAITALDTLHLSHSDYVVLLEFASLHFSSPAKNKYAYKLDPFDPDWSYTDADRRAITYTNLPHGDYTFKVKASNNDGVWNEAGISMFITVAPPWYKILWIQLSALALLIGSVYFAYRNSINKQKQRAALLEATVQERTKEIQEKTVELEQQQEEIITQRDNLEHSYSNVRIMSDIGQQVTAELDMRTMLVTLYENVNQLFDASGFGVGIIQGKDIIFKNFIEKGQTLPDFKVKVDAQDKLPAWCVQHREVIWMNDLQKDYEKYLKGVAPHSLEGALPESLIYLPLSIEQRIIGVMTIQSFNKNAYTNYHLDLLKNLANFIGIALENANNYTVIQDVKQNLEQKNHAILASIRYAKTIQQAILPPIPEIKQHLPEHFILYIPKDIVSGDFYWFIEKNGKLYIAVVDCTGHGVPGAFMSMIGHTLLNEILMQAGNNAISVGEILTLLNKEVKIALRQDVDVVESGTNTDGMDVALCEIDTKQQTLLYAGAKRPLWMVFEGVLKETKGDRKSIGGYHKDAKVEFKTFQVPYQSGAMIYLSSDGYLDQHNPSGKKIGSRKLKELLTNSASKGTEEQLDILTHYLINHRQTTHQRDDIAVIGIRLP